MSLWEVWEVAPLATPLGAGGRRVAILARIRAKHQPDAMIKASKRWPVIAGEQRLTVRSVKSLNELRRRGTRIRKVGS